MFLKEKPNLKAELHSFSMLQCHERQKVLEERLLDYRKIKFMTSNSNKRF